MTCESCNDTKEILVSVGNGVVIDDHLHFVRASRPCPECTEEGRVWEDDEYRQMLDEHDAELAQEAGAA